VPHLRYNLDFISGECCFDYPASDGFSYRAANSVQLAVNIIGLAATRLPEIFLQVYTGLVKIAAMPVSAKKHSRLHSLQAGRNFLLPPPGTVIVERPDASLTLVSELMGE
jgi:hypothetical protein